MQELTFKLAFFKSLLSISVFLWLYSLIFIILELTVCTKANHVQQGIVAVQMGHVKTGRLICWILSVAGSAPLSSSDIKPGY